MSDTTDLLPCPFCGGEARLALATTLRYPTVVECLACPAATEADDEADAIAAWNRRAPPTVPSPDERAERILARWSGALAALARVEAAEVAAPARTRWRVSPWHDPVVVERRHVRRIVMTTTSELKKGD